MLFDYFQDKIDCFSSTPYENDIKYPLGPLVTESELFGNISFLDNIKIMLEDLEVNPIYRDATLTFSIIGVLKHMSLIKYDFKKLKSAMQTIAECIELNTIHNNRDRLVDLIDDSLNAQEYKAYAKTESILWKYNNIALEEWKNKTVLNDTFNLFMGLSTSESTVETIQEKNPETEVNTKSDTKSEVKAVIANELEKVIINSSESMEPTSNEIPVVDVKVSEISQESAEEAINQILFKEHAKIVKTGSWADEVDSDTETNTDKNNTNSESKKSYVKVVKAYAAPDSVNNPVKYISTNIPVNSTVLFTYIIEYNSTQNGISIRFDNVEFPQIKLKHININDIKYQNIDLNEKDNKHALLLSILLYAISIRYCPFPTLNGEDILTEDKTYELTCPQSDNEIIHGIIFVNNDRLNMRYSINNSDVVESIIPLSYSDIIITGGVLNDTANTQYGKNCLLSLKYCSTTFTYINLNKPYVPYKEVYDHIAANGGKRSREYNYNPYKSLLSLIETVNLEYLSKDYNPYGHNYINELKIFSTFSIFKRLVNANL